MTVAHALLASLDVSSPALDALQSTALAAGARGAKLTGAGGGGCLLVLPPDDARPSWSRRSPSTARSRSR
jgi:mevalonate kinase